MRLTKLLGAGLAATFLLGSFAWAQEQQPGQGQTRPKARRRARRRGMSVEQFVQQVLRRVNATEEQEARIRQILETYRQANENVLREQGDVNALDGAGAQW